MRETGTNNYIIYNEVTAEDAFTINRATNNVTVLRNISAANLSGTNTGDQTNISGLAGSETLATVTGRGASTSTALSINNNVTITSGRLTVRTGGVNTYGVVSGYDNNNHMIIICIAILILS
jgi:hypothetical protein